MKRSGARFATLLAVAVLGYGCASNDPREAVGGGGGTAGTGSAGTGGVGSDRGGSSSAGSGGSDASGGGGGVSGGGGKAVAGGAPSGGSSGDGGKGSGGKSGSGAGGAGGNPGPPYARECTREQPTECKLCEDQTSCEAPRYTDNGDGTVTSSCCGFVWQRDTEWVIDPSAPYDDCRDRPGGAGCYDFDGAQAHCAGLTLAGGGWRTPTIAELASLFDRAVPTGPRIDTKAFPNAAISDDYWSSTPSADRVNAAWTLGFGGITGGERPKSGEHFVRCIR